MYVCSYPPIPNKKNVDFTVHTLWQHFLTANSEGIYIPWAGTENWPRLHEWSKCFHTLFLQCWTSSNLDHFINSKYHKKYV